MISRRAVTALCEALAENATRPRLFVLWTRGGNGRRTALRDIARAARLNGYVPISADLDAHLAALAEQRTLLVVARTPSDAWRSLLTASLRRARAHVVILVGDHDLAAFPSVQLDDIPPHRLFDAVVPAPASRDAPRLRAAAVRARGSAARFALELWKAERPRIVAHPSRVAERQPAYGAPPGLAPSPNAPEVQALTDAMNAAVADLRRGRHATGDRALRQAIGALARRHHWADAARGAVALAEALIRRGRTRDARALLAETHQWAVDGRADAVLASAAIVAGMAAIEEAKLDEAEVVLRAALTSAQGLGEPPLVRRAALTLAHALFWRGHYADGASVLAQTAFDASAGVEGVERGALRAMLAAAQQQPAEATAAAAEAVRGARVAADARLVALAAYASAFVHLTLGDASAAEQDALACVQHARAAREPLLGARGRLIAAEALRRAGRPREAAGQLARLSRLPKAHVPPALREHMALAQEVVDGGAPAATADRRARTTGLGALALFVPPANGSAGAFGAAVSDIIDILKCCQTADEDAGVLTSVCARLRIRLRASGVVFFVEDRGVFVAIASDGARVESAIARRIAALQETIPPHRIEERVEGGAPVRYAGRLTGVLAARWSIGTRCDATTAAALLTTAATAAGPAAAALAAQRLAPAGGLPWELLGTSAAIEDVRRAIERAAAAPFAVLVDGESGSGKELVARALHRRGPRRERPFCTLNCAALPEDLVESELFGHARGAFTGAVAERIGVFEEAHGGTLFLDEIGELSARAQAKVLRAIQEGEVRRVGDNLARRVDVRLVAATNRDLRKEVEAGRFRLDLLYRLDVIRIAVPPLRDRRDDIPILAEHFWREATARLRSRAVLGGAALAALARYDWPGNVRELQNVLAALAVRTPKRGVVPADALPPPFDGARPAGADSTWRLDAARRTFERRFIRAALARAGGHRARAAEELGVTRQGLTKLMLRLGIDSHL